MESNFRDIARSQHADYLVALERSVLDTQKRFWEEVAKPKASRRAALPKEYMETTAALLETLDKLSTGLAAAVNHQDPAIDPRTRTEYQIRVDRHNAAEHMARDGERSVEDRDVSRDLTVR